MIKKTFVENYRAYYIYKIVDAVGQVLYVAESPYLSSGYITVSGRTINEVYNQIKSIYNKICTYEFFERIR